MTYLQYKQKQTWQHKQWVQKDTHTDTLPFNGPFSGTTQVSRYQKDKTNLDFTEARDSEWQWHQLDHMQVCTSLQTDNHTSTPPLKFFTGWMPFLPPNQQRQSTEGITPAKGCHTLILSIGMYMALWLAVCHWKALCEMEQSRYRRHSNGSAPHFNPVRERHHQMLPGWHWLVLLAQWMICTGCHVGVQECPGHDLTVTSMHQ